MAPVKPNNHSGHRRRISSSANGRLLLPGDHSQLLESTHSGSAGHVITRGLDEIMLPIPGTPPLTTTPRATSPTPAADWSTHRVGAVNEGPNALPYPLGLAHGDSTAHSVSWASAKAKSARVRGDALRAGDTEDGFLVRSLHSITGFLQRMTRTREHEYLEKDKPQRNYWQMAQSDRMRALATILARAAFRFRKALVALIFLITLTVLFYKTRSFTSAC